MIHTLDTNLILGNMQARGITQADLCRKLGINASGLSTLLRRGRARTDTVARLSGALDMSPLEMIPALRVRQKTTGTLFSQYVIRSHKTMAQVAEESGVSLRTLTKWEADEQYPGLLDAIDVADVLKVSLDKLAGRAET